MSDMRWIEREGRTDTLDAAVIYRSLKDKDVNPNRRFVDSMTLRETSRMAIVVSHSEIIDSTTGEVHHHAVKIESIPKISASKGGGWNIETKNAIWLDDDGRDEIVRLRNYLSVIKGSIPEAVGRYIVLRIEEGVELTESLFQLLQLASSPSRAEAFMKTLVSVSHDSAALQRLIELAADNPSAIEAATAALNIARYREALSTLRSLIDGNSSEANLQTHLEANDWLFGSEYNQRLSLRRLTRNQQQDFVLRRTADDYIEILEIKTTLGEQPLFNYDNSHKAYYPCSPLAMVLGQVVNYIERLDSNRLALLHEENLDTNKIRAKIVIGRSRNPEQLAALRNFNGHLHRIEIMTFDQLVNIGQRMLDQLEVVISRASSDDDFSEIPQGDGEPPF